MQRFGILDAAILVAFFAVMVGVLSRRLTRRAGIAGLSAGIGIGVLSFVIGGWVPFFRASIPMFWITSVTTLAGLFGLSAVLPDGPEERAKTEEFFKGDL